MSADDLVKRLRFILKHRAGHDQTGVKDTMNGPDWWWAQQLLIEQWIEEQAEQKRVEAGLLRADPAYVEWLDKLEQEHKHDERK